MPYDAVYEQKKIASQKALSFIKDNMTLGLGTGSTIDIFLDLLSEHITNNQFNISAVTTSHRTRQKALDLGINILPMNQVIKTDLCIDGTDEFDDHFNLIKGGGGALLCEKIIAQSAKKMIIITDENKYSQRFGRFSLPVEIVDFEIGITLALLDTVHTKHAKHRMNAGIRKTAKGDNFRTDMNNLIVDIDFKEIHNPEELSHDLHQIASVVEHGLFLNHASVILTDKRELYKV